MEINTIYTFSWSSLYELLSLLNLIEWESSRISALGIIPACPDCKGAKPEAIPDEEKAKIEAEGIHIGHKVNCWLEKAIKEMQENLNGKP